jgi:PmbA protein
MVSASDFSKETLTELVERAVAMAKVSTDDLDAQLAPEALLAKEIPDLDLYDDTEPTVESLEAVCVKMEEVALEVEGITNSQGADAGFAKSEIALVTSNGFAKSYKTSRFSQSVTVLAGEGTKMERDYDYHSSRHAEDLVEPEVIGKKAAEYTLRRLNSRKVETQQVPVVFDPRVSNRLVSNVASAINGNAIARGTSFLKDKMGEGLFRGEVQIVDDPHRIRGLSSRPYDSEGVTNQKTKLIEGGILQSWLLDTRTANKLGLQTTGHAGRGLSSPPSPSTSNLYMEAGELSPEALISDIESGLYVTDAFGMGMNLVTGDFSQGAGGLWIEKGELAYPVSELTIAGQMLEMFANLTPADDLEFRYSTNSPTVRIDGMTVAGV